MPEFSIQTTEFVQLCETVRARSARETLPAVDRGLIKYSCIKLLNELGSN
jgi:hypothetical protein